MDTLNQLIALIEATGLWRGERKETHAFQLSPTPHMITKNQGDQLNKIAQALHGCLQGLSRIFTTAVDPILGAQRWWGELGKVMRLQIPSYFEEVMGLKPNAIPILTKIDLVEDEGGKFWIVEIDAGNPRALGYSVFFQRMSQLQGISGPQFPGVLGPIRQATEKNQGRLACMFSDRERWYLPWFEILGQALNEQGTQTTIVQEGHLCIENSRIVHDGKSLDTGLMLYMPLIMSNTDVRSALLEMYRGGGSQFLMPPKPFLGSKALLAILCNIAQDPILEGILRSQISGEHLETLQTHLPETALLQREEGTARFNGPTVLKSLVSSGMKGVVFSSEQKEYVAALRDHTKNRGVTAVLQKVVEGKQVDFTHFQLDGQVIRDTRYVRFIAHCGPRGIADVFVTARRNKAVHGAKDAIMTGCVIE